MIAMFQRELRENVKWAVVICGVLLFFVVHEIREAGTNFLFDFPKHTVFIAPLAGLLMGVVQTLFETRPDNWGFVVHRPISRRKVFITKAAAGLLLLYAGLLIPCAFAWTWAARRGNLAMPFQARMMLPMFADVLNAGSYYFIAMLLVLRRAKWFGTRLLPLGLPLASSMMITFFIGEFWQALSLIVIVQAIGAIAACGIFEVNGENPPSFAPRLALGTAIYPGGIGVLMALIGISQSFASAGGRWQYYQVDRNGNPVRVTQTIQNGERGWSITDPAGNPLPQYAGVDLDDPANSNLFTRFSAHLIDQNDIPWPLTVEYAEMNYRSPTPGVVPMRSGAPRGTRLPFAAIYDVPQHLIDLYDPNSHAQIGTIGPAGFASQGSAPAQRFEGNPINLFLLGSTRAFAFDSQVYWLRLDQRRVQPIFTATPDDPVISASTVGTAANSDAIIATYHKLYLLQPDGTKMFSAALPFDPTQYHFDASLLSNGHLVLQALSTPGSASKDNHVLEYTSDGTVIRRTQLPRLIDARSPKKYETAMFGAMFPLAARPISPSWILDEVIDIRSDEFPHLFEGFMWASALLCALLCLLMSLRCGLGKTATIAWSVASFLLGPAGITVMLALNDWPAREACPACGRNRIVWRRQCSHCGSPEAPSAMDGREIFEPTDALPPDNGLLAAT
jgi:hypothetical protein